MESLWDVWLSVIANKRLRETEIERLRSGLFQGIEDLKELQAENITDMRRIQDQEIQELKDLQLWFNTEEHEETSSSGSGVAEAFPGNITANIQLEGENLSKLRKIYGGSATRHKKYTILGRRLRTPKHRMKTSDGSRTALRLH